MLRHWQVPLSAILLCACGQQGDDAINANVVTALKREMAGVVRLDARLISDVQFRSRCVTVFVTDAGSTAIDWTRVGNFAGRIVNGVATIPIEHGAGRHIFSMPDGDGFRRVDGSLGLLADNCEDEVR